MADVPPRETSSAAKSKEKQLFLQAILTEYYVRRIWSTQIVYFIFSYDKGLQYLYILLRYHTYQGEFFVSEVAHFLPKLKSALILMVVFKKR